MNRVILVLFFMLFFGLTCNAQLPEYLELYNPTIQDKCIASGGRVWNKFTKEIILSVSYKTSLTTRSIFYSDGSNTFVHDNVDGHLITQLPGKDFTYNSFNAMLWNYSNNKFESYSEDGQLIIGLTFSGNGIYPYQNDVRYIRNNSIYKHGFASSGETLLGSFEGTFSNWFLDGEYFLTKLGSVVRLYNKNATLIKLVDMPSTENLGGSGDYFWTYPTNGSASKPLVLHKVNENTVHSYPTGSIAKVFATAKNIAIFPYGVSDFSIIKLTESQPSVTSHEGAGPYLESYDSDINGNWVTGNGSGVVNYGSLTSAPELLNLGRIRSMSGDENSNLVITSSSGHVLLYKFNESLVHDIDTFKINASKAKLSLDGNYLAASGNTFDAQYSKDELSLYVYDVRDRTLVKKWYYNYFRDGSDYLDDFDFSRDGKSIAQKTGKWDAGVRLHSNFLSRIDLTESIFLNHDDNISAPKLSPSGTYAITSLVSPDDDSNIQDISKLYGLSGTLSNAFTGFTPGWISDTKLVFNRLDSIKCNRGSCAKYYSPHIYSVDGQEDNSYHLPDSISNGKQMVKTRALYAMSRISDHELYVNNSNVIDINTGKVLFAFDTIPSLSVPIGSDYITYIQDNSLKIINWRTRSQQVWKKDADGDGFGDPSSNRVFYKNPKGFVNNGTDCNDNDNSINPNTKWYKDQDGDGFGDPLIVEKNCTQPIGYVRDSTDCDDSNEELTPLNLCVVTAIEEQVLDLNLFPNPSDGIYYIRHHDGLNEITIINSVGQSINPTIVRDDEFYVIHMTKEKEGLYILSIKVNSKNLHMKIIKR